MTRRRVGARFPVALSVVSLFVLAGCGASATGGNSNKHSSSPINLGMAAPLTGSRASVGTGMSQGAQLALGVINGDGGVLGRKVNLSVQDTATDPADAAPAAQKLIQTDNVVAIVGPTAITDAVVLPLAIKAKIPNIMWGGGSAFDKETTPYFFRVSPSDTEQSEAMVVYAHQKGWNKIALAFGNTTADTSLVPGIVATAKALHMTITNQVTIAVGSTSFESEITNLFSKHPQAILSQFDVGSTGVFFGELAQRNLLSTPWVASNLWFTSDFFNSVGKKVASGPIYIAQTGTENGGYQNFLKLYKPKYHQNAPTNGATYLYDAVNVWALGAQEAGTVKAPKVEKGIYAVTHGSNVCDGFVACAKLLKQGKSIHYVGASSSMQFDKYHNVYGPFDILHFNSDGSSSAVTTLTAAQIQTAIGK